jgi:hypothetical protein
MTNLPMEVFMAISHSETTLTNHSFAGSSIALKAWAESSSGRPSIQMKA